MGKNRQKKESFLAKLANTIFTLILASVMVVGLQCYSAVSSLKFAQLSDVHFYTGEDNTTFKLRAESDTLLDDAISQVNQITNINFVMFTGDQIDKSFEKELRAFLPHAQKLTAPWYITFGNHDTCIGGYLTPEVYLNMVNKANPKFEFKKPYYSFSPQKGYKVIVLDSIIRDRLTSNGVISDIQLKWFEDELKSADKDTVLIFTHVPIIEPFESSSHQLLNANKVREIIEKQKNPIGVFQGHYHAAMIKQVDNVVYVSSPALVSYPNAFRVVTVTNHKNKVVFDIEMKETNLKNLQKLAKILVFTPKIYTGEAGDQNKVIEIKK